MRKMYIAFLLFAVALSGCWVSIRSDRPVILSAPPPPPPTPPPPEHVESSMPPVEIVAVQEPVPPVVFNEPVFYPPPLVVKYTYDHWMYVVNGRFVDIVFMDQHGVRHIEHWHHSGARMTVANLPEWHRSYHVPSAAIQVHNQKVREYTVKHHSSVKHPPAPAIKSTNLPMEKFSEPPIQTIYTPPPAKDSRINEPLKPEPQSTREVDKSEKKRGKPTMSLKQKKIPQNPAKDPSPPVTVEKPAASAKEVATVQQKQIVSTSKEQKLVHQKPPTPSKRPPNIHEKAKAASKEPATAGGKINTEDKKDKLAQKKSKPDKNLNNKPQKKSISTGKKPDSDSKSDWDR